MNPYLVTFGMGVASSLSNIFIEAVVDTTTDFVIDKANDAFTSLVPQLSNNQYLNQFTNQVRMGMSTATQARIMSKSIQTQMKVENKITALKENATKKYNEKMNQIDGKLLGKGTKGKRKQSLKQQYNEEIKKIEEDGKRIYQMSQTANTEAMTFTGGTGLLKSGHDGTIQNLKPTPTAELSSTIKDLLNSQGYYVDKSGVGAL